MATFRRHKIVLLILFLACLSPRANGQGLQSAGIQPLLETPPDRPGPLNKGEIRLSSSIDKQIIRIGDLVHYRLAISAPAGSAAVMPQAGSELGGFIIRDYRITNPSEQPQSIVDRAFAWIEARAGTAAARPIEQVFDYTITSYDVGDQVIPPLPMIVLDPEGKAHTLFAPSARIRVVAVTSPDDLTIRDIAAPITVPFKPGRFYYYLIFPAALLIALIAAVILFRRWKRPLEKISAPRLPAHEIALAELLALEAEDLLKSGDFERFYVRLSHILRKYLALRYSIYALEYTSQEILERLKRLDLALADFETVRGFLTESDMVKFARHSPGPQETRSAVSRVRGVVEHTRELPPVEAAP